MASLAYSRLTPTPTRTTTTITPTSTGAPKLLKGASDTQIDQTNQWMRQQPWYQQLLQSWGQDPGHPHNLSDQQKTAIVRAAQANGMVVDEGHIKIDDGGNFSTKGGSLLKDILIGAGIGGLALTGLGAAGIGPLSGLFGAGSAAAGAGAGASEAGLLPSTVLPQAFSTLPAVTSSLTGSLTPSLLASTVLPQAMSTLPNVSPSIAPSVFSSAADLSPVATGGQGTPSPTSMMGNEPAPTTPTDVAPGSPEPGGLPSTTTSPTGTLPTTPQVTDLSEVPPVLPSTPTPGSDQPMGLPGAPPTNPNLNSPSGTQPPPINTKSSTTTDLLKAILPNLLSPLAQAYGANQQANASVEAAKIQAAEYDKALAQALQMWQTKQANLAPYMNVGAGAAANMAYGMGIPYNPSGSSSSSTPTFTAAPGTTPLNLPPGTTVPATGPGTSPALANPATLPITPADISSHLALGTPPAGYVRVRSPQGTVSQIPVGQLTAALQQGWIQV